MTAPAAATAATTAATLRRPAEDEYAEELAALAAAICGTSRLIVQGTAGTAEEAIRYGWNYALLLAKGPSREAVVRSPVMRAMEAGLVARVEELTRIPSETQDTLITVLSEKVLPIPELGEEVPAARGFNLIATANNRDRGVNELSSALKRRFNTVVLPTPATAEAVSCSGRRCPRRNKASIRTSSAPTCIRAA